MNTEIKERINKLLDFLGYKLNNQEIIKINKNENKEIYDYLEEEKCLSVFYRIGYKGVIGIETEAHINLWYKDINKDWSINMYQIYKMLNANYK